MRVCVGVEEKRDHYTHMRRLQRPALRVVLQGRRPSAIRRVGTGAEERLAAGILGAGRVGGWGGGHRGVGRRAGWVRGGGPGGWGAAITLKGSKRIKHLIVFKLGLAKATVMTAMAIDRLGPGRYTNSGAAYGSIWIHTM